MGALLAGGLHAGVLSKGRADTYQTIVALPVQSSAQGSRAHHLSTNSDQESVSAETPFAGPVIQIRGRQATVVGHTWNAAASQPYWQKDSIPLPQVDGYSGSTFACQKRRPDSLHQPNACQAEWWASVGRPHGGRAHAAD